MMTFWNFGEKNYTFNVQYTRILVQYVHKILISFLGGFKTMNLSENIMYVDNT